MAPSHLNQRTSPRCTVRVPRSYAVRVTVVMRGFARHAPAIIVAAIFVLPLVMMISGSLRPVGLPPPVGLELIPSTVSLGNYARLAELVPLWTWLANSAIVVAVAVPVTVLVASWAAFGIRLLRRPARRVAVVTLIVAAARPGDRACGRPGSRSTARSACSTP